MTLYDWCIQNNKQNILAEWDSVGNGELTPHSISAKSHRKVWWTCVHGHKWSAVVSSRSNGCNCPVCMSTKILSGYNDLKTKYPQITAEWHPTKNLPLTPDSVAPKSNKKVWWKCSVCGKEWEMLVSKRTIGQGCPDCAKGRRVSFYEKTIPFYLKKAGVEVQENIRPKWLGGLELDVYLPQLNVGIQYDGRYTHRKNANDLKANMRCRDNGIYLIRIREPGCDPAGGDGCFVHTLREKPDRDISSLNDAIRFLLEHLNAHYNLFIPADLLIDVDADRISIYEAMKLRQEKDSLAARFPEIAAEWNYAKNKTVHPESVLPGSEKKVWWRCAFGHEWQAIVHSRTRGTGCPICAGNKVLFGFNDLETCNPNLSEEWHPTKNGTLTPGGVTAKSSRKVWWKCPVCKHEWQAPVYSRAAGNGCPACGLHKNRTSLMKPKPGRSLAEQKPELSKQWHPTKNGLLTPKLISVKSHQKVWWICEQGHEWMAVVSSRSIGNGCPMCYELRRKKSQARIND